MTGGALSRPCTLTMISFHDPDKMTDSELAAQAQLWRLRALRGAREARGPAHLYEAAQRRRLRETVSSNAMVDSASVRSTVTKAWWLSWWPF